MWIGCISAGFAMLDRIAMMIARDSLIDLSLAMMITAVLRAL
jgi:hypothetical protein